MTTIGHSLTGLSLALATAPPSGQGKRFVLVIAAYVVFANVPDFPVPGWGHHSYYLSHSIFVPLILAALLARYFARTGLPASLTPGLVAGLVVAWLSHLLLDSMYGHGYGLPMFWPVSGASLALPIDRFETLQLPMLSEHNRQVLVEELKVFCAVLAIVAACRALARRIMFRGPGR
jgi:membrane-bound metal-dependent hydrolase YbcI (DUF457 family)